MRAARCEKTNSRATNSRRQTAFAARHSPLHFADRPVSRPISPPIRRGAVPIGALWASRIYQPLSRLCRKPARVPRRERIAAMAESGSLRQWNQRREWARCPLKGAFYGTRQTHARGEKREPLRIPRTRRSPIARRRAASWIRCVSSAMASRSGKTSRINTWPGCRALDQRRREW